MVDAGLYNETLDKIDLWAQIEASSNNLKGGEAFPGLAPF